MFLSAGMVTAAWATIIPFIKEALQISDSIIGGLLLCLGLGAMVGMPLAGIGTSRYGCRSVLMVSVTGFALLFMIIPVAGTIFTLALVLLVFGMLLGITDCTMNIQAVAVEKAEDQTLMSGFHGFYSLGGMIGALFVTTQLAFNISIMTACIATSAMVLLFLVFVRHGLLEKVQTQSGSVWVLPQSVVVLIGLVCCILFLAEGTVLDWSGIFLTEYRGVSNAMAGLGVACFSVATTIGRLTGDYVVLKLGPRRVINVGTLTAIAGLLTTLHSEAWQMALIGYTLVGLGIANTVPIMFSATGKQNVMPEAMAVTAVSTLGYVGVLAGPALVGFSADVFSLPLSLHLIVALLILSLAVSRNIRV
ncbi:MFS transporter [Alteromonas pelagimontana]|uniref:MFS transporter n=2 Tax=Alteromonas pelagimontana TaxID=1858656 RepID=A0A6N3IVN1_9ALTE|nr:MFS transporter [Alteromonas pelagimontana]